MNKDASGCQNIFEVQSRKFGTDSFRRRGHVEDKPQPSGRRGHWRYKTEYAIQVIFKQRRIKCTGRKYTACHGEKYQQAP